MMDVIASRIREILFLLSIIYSEKAGVNFTSLFDIFFFLQSTSNECASREYHVAYIYLWQSFSKLRLKCKWRKKYTYTGVWWSKVFFSSPRFSFFCSSFTWVKFFSYSSYPWTQPTALHCFFPAKWLPYEERSHFFFFFFYFLSYVNQCCNWI